MTTKRNPTSHEIEQAKADLEAMTPEEWQPVDGDEVEIRLEGQKIQPGSMFAVGRSGTVFVQSPDGNLTICPNVETMAKPTVAGSSDSIRVEQKGEQLFLYVDGRKIAKRGLPGTVRAGTWIPLVPDVLKVIDDSDSSIVVEYKRGKAH